MEKTYKARVGDIVRVTGLRMDKGRIGVVIRDHDSLGGILPVVVQLGLQEWVSFEHFQLEPVAVGDSVKLTKDGHQFLSMYVENTPKAGTKGAVKEIRTRDGMLLVKFVGRARPISMQAFYVAGAR